MKKVLVAISICALAGSASSAVFSSTESTVKKQSKIRRHIHTKVDKKIYKDEPVMEAGKTDDVTPTWLTYLSGTFALTSNYMFRGISQSQNNPAAQGGLTYTFPVGLYFSTWGSNVNFAAPDGKTATSELDAIVGWRSTIGEDFTYDINFDRYNYPGARYSNYNELNTLFIYRFFQLGISYTSNYSGYHGRGLYTNGTVTFEIPPAYIFNFENITVLGEYGHYALSKVGGNSYNDYSLGINKKISNTYTVGILGTGTNGRANNPPFDGNQIVGTVTAVF